MPPIWKDIGPVEASLGGTVLGKTVANPGGGTHGGGKFRLATPTAESFRDHTGKNPYDETVLGTKAEVMLALTGQSIDQMAALIPGATLTAGPTSKRLDIKSAVGYSLRDNAKELILKPIINGVATTDETQWITASLAHPKPDIELAFDMETQRVWNVLFAIFDDLTTGVVVSVGKQSSS